MARIGYSRGYRTGSKTSALATLFASQNIAKGAQAQASATENAARINAMGAMERTRLTSDTSLMRGKMQLQGQLEKVASDRDYHDKYLTFLDKRLNTQEKREWAKLINLAKFRQARMVDMTWGRQNQEEYNRIMSGRTEEMARHNVAAEAIDTFEAETGRGQLKATNFKANTARALANAQIGNLAELTNLNKARGEAYPFEARAKIGLQTKQAQWYGIRPEIEKLKMEQQAGLAGEREKGMWERQGAREEGIEKRFNIGGRAGKQQSALNAQNYLFSKIITAPNADTIVSSYLMNKYREGAFDNLISPDKKEEIEQMISEGQAINWSVLGIDMRKAINNMVQEALYYMGIMPSTNKKGIPISPGSYYGTGEEEGE